MSNLIPSMLVIDADPMFHSLIEAHFHNSIKEIHGASTLQDGISLLARHREIRFVLVSLSNSVHAAAQILELNPGANIICIHSGLVTPSMKEEAKKIGARILVSKPLNLLYLTLLLEALTKQSKPSD